MEVEINNKLKIKIKNYDNSGGKKWLSVENITGGTCRDPYSPVTIEELYKLKEMVDKTLIELLENKTRHKII